LAGKKQPKHVGKFYSNLMTAIFFLISANCTQFEVSSLALGLELQVPSFGLRFLKKSWSRSRSFNQDSVSNVMVSTTSLLSPQNPPWRRD